ncbi:hypothetical protein EVAR_103121_1 [Eumeta japonica]|uniref:Uncharacterized protein n=1 Tax=Eumeta variegata TaxID=151549 RepID=A0A4C1X2Z4_EUMVA|nr:hypothetical protein EVAR_103121_1 [Eumeta japonica]
MAKTKDNISAVRLMIETDKTMPYQQTRTSLGVGMSQVPKIRHEHFAYCFHLLPHQSSPKTCHELCEIQLTLSPLLYSLAGVEDELLLEDSSQDIFKYSNKISWRALAASIPPK